jgi:quercetin dioxygenase-like cupin family protein
MSDDWKALAAAYALGVLEWEEADSAALRTQKDKLFAEETLVWSERFARLTPLPENGAPPPAGAWQAIAARTGSQSQSRRNNEGVWLPIGERVTMKMLMVDPPSGRRTVLLRLLPGAALEAHYHQDFEECLVLEGEVEIDGETFGVGDYFAAAAWTTHSQIPSPKGALVLLHLTAG